MEIKVICNNCRLDNPPSDKWISIAPTSRLNISQLGYSAVFELDFWEDAFENDFELTFGDR